MEYADAVIFSAIGLYFGYLGDLYKARAFLSEGSSEVFSG